MRFINLITISAVAASNVAIPTGMVAEESTVDESSSTTTKAPAKIERIPHFFEEWNMVMEAVEKLVEKVADEDPSVEELSKRFAPFPGVIGI
jgi:hypothetical protein